MRFTAGCYTPFEHSGCRPVPLEDRRSPAFPIRVAMIGPFQAGPCLAELAGSPHLSYRHRRQNRCLGAALRFGGWASPRAAPGPRVLSASARSLGDARPALTGSAPDSAIRPTAVLQTPRTLEHLHTRSSAAHRAKGRTRLPFGVVTGDARVPRLPREGPPTSGQDAHPLVARAVSGRSRSRRLPFFRGRIAPLVDVGRLAGVRRHPGRRPRVLRA